MAGSLRSQEGTVQTITSTGAAASTGSAILAGQLDARSSGPAALADMFVALFSLTAAWTTVSGIAAGSNIADLYLVPAIDGVNFPDIDVTAGASYISPTMLAASFSAAKAPTSAVNALFQSAPVDLMPALYNVYILNRSGQTMSSGWALKVLAAAAQYT